MAGGRKEYELLFKLKAALGGNFNSTFQSAMNSTKQLQDTLTRINSLSGKIDGYKKQTDAVERNRAKLVELNAEHERLQREMSETEQPSEALRRRFERNQRQIETTTTSIAEQERRLEQLGGELRSAGVNTNNLEGANERLARSYEAVRRSQQDLANINAAQQKNAAAIANTKSQIAGTVGVISALGAVTYAGAIKPAIEFESAIAGVNKTINGTPAQLLKIQNGIRKMSTEIPLSVVEIAAISEAAGQLGIKTESILGFTRTMADLGVTTNLAGEEAASTLAKFANITGMSQNNFDRLGATIVALGNNLATTESDIAAMGLRLAGAGKQVGLTEAQILSFAGALSSVGIEAEAGGSAFSKVMVDMQLAVETGNKDLTNFSRVAGMSAAEFKKAFQTDAAGAINTFIKGLGKSQEKGESAIKILDDMGITEVRMRDALLRAAGASGVFTQSVELGTEAWKENIALAEEAQKRYATTQSSMKIMKQAFNDIGISLGSVFLPHLASTAKHVSILAQKFSEFAQKNPEMIVAITKTIAGLLAFKLATSTVMLGFLELKGGVLAVQKIFTLFRGRAAVAGVEAMTLSGRLTTAGAGIRNYFGGIRGALGGLGNAIGSIFSGGRIAAMFSGIGSGIGRVFGGIGGIVARSFGGIGGRIVGVFGDIGARIVAGPLGRIGMMIAKPFMSIGRLIAPLMNLGGAILGPFSGIFGKIFPVVGVVMLIVAAFQILKKHIDDVRKFVEKVFGKAGLAVFDKVVATIGNIGNAIKNVFSDGGIQNIRGFIDETFGNNPALANFLNGFVTVFQAIGNIVGQFITFVGTYVAPVVEQVFGYIVNTILPMVAQKFAEWAPTIASIIQGLWTIIQGVATAIMGVVQFLMPTIQAIVGTSLNALMGIVGGALSVIKGVIDVFIGIFTGNWKQAWEGVKSIFSGVWQAMKSIVKAPLNFIITGVNTLIRGLNKLKIPDWVPGVGGKGLSIPEIPMFAKGTNSTPDTFIAGEKGAELITNAKGRKVFTAAQTGQIFNNINKGTNNYNNGDGENANAGLATLVPVLQSIVAAVKTAVTPNAMMFPQLQLAYGASTAAGISAPTVRAGTTERVTKIEINNQPIIHIDGNKPDDLDEKLRKNNESLLNQMDEKLRRKEEDERRSRYE